MTYNFQLELLNTVIILRSIQGEILNISKKVEDDFYEMSLIAKDIYYDKVGQQYWKKSTQFITIHGYEIIQEEYIEVTPFLVENRKLTNELKKDPLTKIGNVAAADAKEKEILLTGMPCVMVYCDVNNFKTINDTYGHLIGDKALQGIARILDKNKRNEQDCISRIGGDEFFLIFETSNMISILEKMSLIQKEINMLGEVLDIPLSISVGLSFFPGDEEFYIKKKEELLAKKVEADQALYFVKHNTNDKNNIAYLNPDTHEFQLYHPTQAVLRQKKK